jgi:hypothetical protein
MTRPSLCFAVFVCPISSAICVSCYLCLPDCGSDCGFGFSTDIGADLLTDPCFD